MIGDEIGLIMTTLERLKVCSACNVGSRPKIAILDLSKKIRVTEMNLVI